MSSEVEPAGKYAHDEYDTAKLREMLTKAFDDSELTAFTFDHFLDIHEQYAYGMKKAIKISLLIEGCYRHNKLDDLLGLLAKYRPEYSWHETIKPKEQENRESSRRGAIRLYIPDINLEELTKAQKDSLALGFKVALASVLNLAVEEVRIEDMIPGSMILEVSLPIKAVMQLLFIDDEYLAQELGIQKIIAADLRRANLRRADLSGADLRRADLSGADLHRANLRAADLRAADLRGANLIGANLIGANLIGANLIGADLRASNLSEADLRAANLSGADLRGALLYRAVLDRADLIGADLSGAFLSKDDLIRAGLSESNMVGAIVKDR